MRLELRDISIDLGKKPTRRIIDAASFTARDGEFLSLLGASGAGKSTLLKIISGILLQDSGSVLFNGEAVDSLPAHRRKVGFVFQDARLFPNMNVEENVAFPCKMAGMPRRERLEQAATMLRHVHLEGFGERDVLSLSGGQQQRVALARALAEKPQILLLDEPFSGLDENLRDEMRSLVLRLHHEFNITTILVTHDAIEALEMSDSIVYISNGRVIQQGSPKELFEQPASHEIAACFGECSVLTGLVVDGRFRREGLELPAASCPDGNAVAVVRYAGLSVAESAADAGGAADAAACCADVEGAAAEVACCAGPSYEFASAAEGTLAELRLKCSVYRGEEYLHRIDLAGQTLTVPSRVTIPPGTRISVRIPVTSVFVFPLMPAETVDDQR